MHGNMSLLCLTFEVDMQVAAQLRGEQALPWEEDDPAAPAVWQNLGSMRGPVSDLLQRNPLLRPSVATFRDACNDALHAM